MEQQVTDGILVVTVSGQTTLREARARVVQAIRQAAEDGLHRVLVDALDAQGIETPSISQRIDMAHEWVEAAQPGLALAVAAPERLLDEERIAAVLAMNMGMRAHSASSREACLAWLRAQESIGRQDPALGVAPGESKGSLAP